MHKFWSYISSDKYSIGCTGQTVYVYNREGEELAKFKDLTYAYHAIFSPSQNMFVVKSTEGRLAVYSLDTLSLIRKFRFSKVDGSQDDGYCFSADGRYFYNVERHGSSVHSAISVYDTSTFARVNMYLQDDENTEPKFIECHQDGQLYILGFLRGEHGVMENGFVAKFEDDQLQDIHIVEEDVFEFYRNYKDLELMGFTDKAKNWSGFKYLNMDMTGMEKMEYPLSELWRKSR